MKYFKIKSWRKIIQCDVHIKQGLSLYIFLKNSLLDICDTFVCGWKTMARDKYSHIERLCIHAVPHISGPDKSMLVFAGFRTSFRHRSCLVSTGAPKIAVTLNV